MDAIRTGAIVIVGCLIAAPLAAQPEAGGFASLNVSAISIDRDTTASIAGSMGYRFNPIVAVGIELTYVPSFRAEAPDILRILDRSIPSIAFVDTRLPSGGVGSLIFPPPEIVVDAAEGRASVFTGIIRLSVPTRAARISPYLVGGAGAGHIRDEVRYISIPTPSRPNGTIVFQAFTETFRRSTTAFAMTFGGGVSVIVADGWSIDADARYLGVAGSRDVHTGRYGGGVTFRF
jgi:opacity protein-like surface antigen